MNNDPEMTQMLELEDKNFKAGNLTVLKDVKDHILIINTDIENSKETETIKNENSSIGKYNIWKNI